MRTVKRAHTTGRSTSPSYCERTHSSATGCPEGDVDASSAATSSPFSSISSVSSERDRSRVSENEPLVELLGDDVISTSRLDCGSQVKFFMGLWDRSAAASARPLNSIHRASSERGDIGEKGTVGVMSDMGEKGTVGVMSEI